MKHVKIFTSKELYIDNKDSLINPNISGVLNYTMPNGTVVPVKIMWSNYSNINNGDVNLVVKYQFNGTIYNTKEQALFALFNAMNDGSITDIVFNSNTITKYHFDGDTPSVDNIDNTVWYDEETEGWEYYNDSTSFTTDIQEFIEDLKSNNTIYQNTDYDCCIDGNLYSKKDILSDTINIDQDSNIIGHTQDWSDFVEEFQETATMPAGELPEGYYIPCKVGCGDGHVAKSYEELLEINEQLNRGWTEDYILNMPIVKLTNEVDEYGNISDSLMWGLYNIDSYPELSNLYVCKVSEWDWERTEITTTKYRVTINGSEIGVYDKLGDDFVWNYYFEDDSYANYDDTWYYNNEGSAYRAIYDYLRDNWFNMTDDEKISWLPYIDYSVYYHSMSNYNELNSFIFDEGIDPEIAFLCSKLTNYVKDKVEEYVNSLPNVDVWYINYSDYTIGCPDYSSNYDTLEEAVENEYSNYNSITNSYEVYKVKNGDYYTWDMLSNIIDSEINNYQSGSETIIDFNSLIKEVKE